MTLRSGALLLVIAAPVAAQSLERRVAAAPDGAVRFAYAARPDVCGDDGRDTMDGRVCACAPGPVRVSLQVRTGRITDLRMRIGSPPPDGRGAATDLGTVPVADAARFLLDLAVRDSGAAGEHAVFAATLADSVTVWPDLLRLARDARVVHRTRRQAVFWLGQAAAQVTRDLDSLASDDHQDRDVREAAVFALSQRPRDEGVPVLVRIARSNHDPTLRRKAIFWLGQSDDPRAVALFEELLAPPPP